MIAVGLLTLARCNVPDTVELPATQPELAINCIGFTNLNWTARVSASQDILKDSSFRNISGASINIYENGVFSETLVEGGILGDVEHGQYYTGSLKPTPGNTYKITVQARGYASAESEYVQPDSIQINSIEVKYLGPSQQFLGSIDAQLRVEFTDPPGEDFYEIAGVAFNDSLNRATQILYIRLVDPAYDDNNQMNNTLVFDDSYFDGKTVKLDFLTPLFYRTNTWIACFRIPEVNKGAQSISAIFQKSITTIW